ncbi:MAG: hypothetical protein IJW05_00510 [Lentisphaeria bacterium]|nr:hypothetical protein [Lentisphaeria bacterium]MBQ9772146.1 hypothetical protein [Lentisphaeria bacterium]MBR2439982.1 hypothetical protein [Lentisphaeria bacterium]
MFSEKCAKIYHVKKGDVVEVLSGEWKKETGKITAVLKKKDRVVLEITSLSADKLENRIGMKTVKKTQANPRGGMVRRSVSVHVSNVRVKENA